MGLTLTGAAKELAARTGGYLEITWGGPVPSLDGAMRTYRWVCIIRDIIGADLVQGMCWALF